MSNKLKKYEPTKKINESSLLEELEALRQYLIRFEEYDAADLIEYTRKLQRNTATELDDNNINSRIESLISESKDIKDLLLELEDKEAKKVKTQIRESKTKSRKTQFLDKLKTVKDLASKGIETTRNVLSWILDLFTNPIGTIWNFIKDYAVQIAFFLAKPITKIIWTVLKSAPKLLSKIILGVLKSNIWILKQVLKIAMPYEDWDYKFKKARVNRKLAVRKTKNIVKGTAKGIVKGIKIATKIGALTTAGILAGQTIKDSFNVAKVKTKIDEAIDKSAKQTVKTINEDIKVANKEYKEIIRESKKGKLIKSNKAFSKFFSKLGKRAVKLGGKVSGILTAVGIATDIYDALEADKLNNKGFAWNMMNETLFGLPQLFDDLDLGYKLFGTKKEGKIYDNEIKAVLSKMDNSELLLREYDALEGVDDNIRKSVDRAIYHENLLYEHGLSTGDINKNREKIRQEVTKVEVKKILNSIGYTNISQEQISKFVDIITNNGTDLDDIYGVFADLRSVKPKSKSDIIINTINSGKYTVPNNVEYIEGHEMYAGIMTTAIKEFKDNEAKQLQKINNARLDDAVNTAIMTQPFGLIYQPTTISQPVTIVQDSSGINN